MINLPDTLFDDDYEDYEILISLKSDHLPSDEYSYYELVIAETSRIVHKTLSHTDINYELTQLSEVLDETEIQEIKKLISGIKLPLIINETEHSWCDGSYFKIEISSKDFEFSTSWSDEEEQEVHKPLQALAEYIFSL